MRWAHPVSIALLALFFALLWVAYTYGRFQQSTFDRRCEMRREDKIMANLSRLEAAVTAAVALIQQLRAVTPEDPATQAKADELAAQLEQATQPPA